MKEYRLICGSSFTFDDEDEPTVVALSPLYLYSGYVGNRDGLLLHNILMDPPLGFCVDHIDRNPLNNTRQNLRIVTRSENHFNRPQQTNNTSGYKGVTLHKKNRKWVAHIRINGALMYLGSFVDPKEAAKAYNQAAIRFIGQAAYLNLI